MIRDATTDTEVIGLGAGEAAFLVDQQGRIVAADPVGGAWLDSKESHAARPEMILASGAAREALALIMSGKSEVAFEASMPHLSGTESPVHARFRRMDGDCGPLTLVTLRQGPAAVVRDPLTGLPDRRAIVDRVASWRSGNSMSSPRFAVLFLDLDGFKQINDEHGHAAGDYVLQEVATRLARCVRDGDLVARYGGDEFVLLLKNIATVEDAEPVVERLRKCTRETIDVSGLQLRVSATVGVAIAEGADQPFEDVVAAADRDMYAQKRRRPK